MIIWQYLCLYIFAIIGMLKDYDVSAASLSLALRYLQRFGYIDHDTQGGLAAQVYRDDFVAAVKSFQRFSGLDVTGRTDSKTLTRMRSPRCGNPDPVHRDPNSRAFILQGSKWDKLDLTFKIGQYSRTLSRKAVDEIIGKAFSYWSKPSGLTFTQVDSGPADIVILFARGEHGDLSPFDGPQGVLAHAFFPDFGGDTHFDDSERWTQSARNGVNLLQVAVHELGHALGLDHSDVAAAVMAPFYDGFNPKFELHTDDIAGIRRLYPLREGTTGATESLSEMDESFTTSMTTMAAATRPPFRTRFSSPRTTSTTTISSHTISFSKEDKTTQTTLGSTGLSTTVTATPMVTTLPITTSMSHSEGGLETLEDEFVNKIPSTTQRTENRTALISNVSSSAGKSASTSATTSTTSSPGRTGSTMTTVPITDISIRNASAAPDLCNESFVIDAITTSDGAGYLFSGDYYWTISAMGEVLLPGRRISADWGGLPGNLDAALTPSWAQGRTYFFKGSWYWRMQDRKIDAGYPKLIRASWGGVPDDIDSAFQWGKNSRTYFVKGNQIWYFDRTKLPPVRGPKPLPVDRGFPQQIDAAFRSSNGRTYLFSKDKYYAMSTWSFLVSRYYPQPTAPRWFGCGVLSEVPQDHLLFDPSKEEFDLQRNANGTSQQLPTSLRLSLYPIP